MQYTVKIDEPSKITRKLTITVAKETIADRFQSKLAEAQRSAKIKGFRQGKVPINIIKQHYADDVRTRVVRTVIDESFGAAIADKNIRTVGMPQIELSEDSKKPENFSSLEERSLTYTATVEIFPVVEPKTYKGLSIVKEKAEVTDGDLEKVIANMADSRAEVTPIENSAQHRVKNGDFVDFDFDGKLVTETGLEEFPGMKGNRMVEVGGSELIPGFEEHFIGMKPGEEKTFRLKFPKEYNEPKVAEKEAEFFIKLNDVKQKIVPALDDEFAKSFNYENMKDLRDKTRATLEVNKKNEAERKTRSAILQALVEKNPFECPKSLIEAQARRMMEELVQNFRAQKYGDEVIQQALMSEQEGIRKRAENEVRAALLIDSISKKEAISVEPADLKDEYTRLAKSVNMDEEKVREYYEATPERRENLEFRIKEDKTVKLLLDNAKSK